MDQIDVYAKTGRSVEELVPGGAVGVSGGGSKAELAAAVDLKT